MKAADQGTRQLMKRWLGRWARKTAELMGYQLSRPEPTLPVDFDEGAASMIAKVNPYTITSPERIYALREAVRYVERAAIPGAIVECGVWSGGSMLAVVLTLQELGSTSRELYLYDTFEGMSPPGPLDIDFEGEAAEKTFGAGAPGASEILPPAPLPQVRALLESTGYPAEHLHFVKGDVAETIPGDAPAEIALLRLDTDWYESTQHELRHLFPLIPDGGILMIDDYGHWQGARRAVDEYFDSQGLNLMLNRIDYTGRLAVVRRSEPRAAKESAAR